MPICAEHFTGWAVAQSTYNATSDTVVKFVEKIYYIHSDRRRLSYAITPPDSPRKPFSRSWNIMEFHGRLYWRIPMSNGRAEQIVGTVKKSIGRFVVNKKDDWDSLLYSSLEGYRHRPLSSGIYPFQLL